MWHHHYPEVSLGLSFPWSSGLQRKPSSPILLYFFNPTCFSTDLTTFSASGELTIIEWLIGRLLPSEIVWLLLSLCSFDWKRTDEFKDALLSKEPLYYPPALLTLQKYKAKFPLCLFPLWNDCFVAFWRHKGLYFKIRSNFVKWKMVVNRHSLALVYQTVEINRVMRTGVGMGVKLGWK